MGLVNSVTTRASSAISYVATNVSYGFTQTVSFGGRVVQQLPSAGYNAFQMTRSAAQSVVPSSLFGRVAAGAGLLVVAVVVYRSFINTPAVQIASSRSLAEAAKAAASKSATEAQQALADAKADFDKLPDLIAAEKEVAAAANPVHQHADAFDGEVAVSEAGGAAAPAEDDRLVAARTAVTKAEAAATEAAAKAAAAADAANSVATTDPHAAVAVAPRAPTQADANAVAKAAKAAQDSATEAAKQAGIAKAKAAEVAATVTKLTPAKA